MKTAISVPDDTFDEVSERAATMGISRSEFFSEAARRYLNQLDTQSTTAEIDEAIALIGDDDTNAVAVWAGRARLAEQDDEW